jgi:hypothetical protein
MKNRNSLRGSSGLISPGTIVASAVIPTPVSATAAATAIAASAATTAAIATTTASAATLLLIRFFYRKLFTFQTGAVEGLDGRTGIGVIWHVYKAKTPALSGLPVEDHFSRTDFAVQFHHLLEIDIIQIGRKTCYKKLHKS